MNKWGKQLSIHSIEECSFINPEEKEIGISKKKGPF
jgi:hypothetical protein